MKYWGILISIFAFITLVNLLPAHVLANTQDPEACERWSQGCDTLNQEECLAEGAQGQCQWLPVGKGNCIARMDKCNLSCFVDYDPPIVIPPGIPMFNEPDQICKSDQESCINTIDNSIPPQDYDVIYSLGACGPIPETGSSLFDAESCSDLVDVCEELEISECSTYSLQGVNVCQPIELGNAGESCMPRLTPRVCGEYCAADIDLGNNFECFASNTECLNHLTSVDPDETENGSCNITSVAIGGADNVPGGSFTGSGISAAFELDGFEPFENVEGLYVRDGQTASIPQFINTFLGFIIGISGAAVVVIIVVSGFQYVTAAAGTSKTASKERVTEALIGLVILLCSVAILNTINPRLLNLDQLEPIKVNITQQELEGDRTGYGGGVGSSVPGGVPDDLYRDSTSITCAAGTTDAGIETGYYRGQSYEIRLCELSNIRDVSGGDNGSKVLVNSRISANVQAMVDAMIADGLNPSVRDSFRTNEAQRRLYNSNCNTRGCNPPTARPGYSRHQSGNALDITTGSSADTVMRGGCQTRPGVETWVWLNENASRFQMKQLCSEAWHWSPDGH